MPINLAKNHFLGKEGFERLNCAQSLVYAFKEKFHVDADINLFKQYGGGRAPEGLCGAVYATNYILKKGNMDGKVKDLEKVFLEHASALKCRDIKDAKKLSCLGCVEKCSEFLANTDHVEY